MSIVSTFDAANAALTQTDYAHANIAERARTDWRDEPLIPLVPVPVKRTPASTGHAARNKSYDAMSATDAAYQNRQGAR